MLLQSRVDQLLSAEGQPTSVTEFFCPETLSRKGNLLLFQHRRRARCADVPSFLAQQFGRQSCEVVFVFNFLD